MGLTSTLAEVKGFYPARLTFKVEDLLPAIDDAEAEYLVEQILGDAFYDELVAAYEGSTLDADQLEVVKLCRRATVNFALHHALSSLNVTLQSTGIGVVNNGDVAPASVARTNALKADLLRAGYRGLDRLISHLLKNYEDFDTWTDANPLYDELVSGFIRETNEFDAIVRIGRSGWLFSRMKPTMKRVEETLIAPVLCSDDFYQDLLTKIEDEDLDEYELKVVKLARVAIAHYTMAESITKLSLHIDKSGIWAFNTLAAGETSGGPLPVDAKRLDALVARYEKDGTLACEQLTALCQKLAEEGNLPLYAASDCYVDPNVAPEPEDDRTDDAAFGGF
jgi:hypothetical protein